jgi:hypothetical protein
LSVGEHEAEELVKVNGALPLLENEASVDGSFLQEPVKLITDQSENVRGSVGHEELRDPAENHVFVGQDHS